MILISWILGFKTRRFWFDWGVPVMFLWLAWEIRDGLSKNLPYRSLARLVFTFCVALVFFLSSTNDHRGRYTGNKPVGMFYDAGKEWLPEEGGVFYASRMPVFYRTFYTHPHGDWKYVLGFEPAIMPEEDLTIFRFIQTAPLSTAPYAAWIHKMGPGDRIALTPGEKNTAEAVEGMEWRYFKEYGFWIGRRTFPGKAGVRELPNKKDRTDE
jgi:hypothetical protein